MSAILTAITTICVASLIIQSIACCARVPQGPHGRKGRGDNGYRIIIGDEPSGYEPGKIYNCKKTSFLLNFTFLLNV